MTDGTHRLENSRLERDWVFDWDGVGDVVCTKVIFRKINDRRNYKIIRSKQGSAPVGMGMDAGLQEQRRSNAMGKFRSDRVSIPAKRPADGPENRVDKDRAVQQNSFEACVFCRTKSFGTKSKVKIEDCTMTYPDLSKITSLDQIPDGMRFNNYYEQKSHWIVKNGTVIFSTIYGKEIDVSSELNDAVQKINTGKFFPCDSAGKRIPWPPQEPVNAELAKLEGKYFRTKLDWMVMHVKGGIISRSRLGSGLWEKCVDDSYAHTLLEGIAAGVYPECDASGNPIAAKVPAESLEGKIYTNDVVRYGLANGICMLVSSSGAMHPSYRYNNLNLFLDAIAKGELVETKENPKPEPPKYSQSDQDLRDRLLVGMAPEILRYDNGNQDYLGSQIDKAFGVVDAIMAEREKRRMA